MWILLIQNLALQSHWLNKYDIVQIIYIITGYSKNHYSNKLIVEK